MGGSRNPSAWRPFDGLEVLVYLPDSQPPASGDQTIRDVLVELAGAQVSINAAKSRHQQTAGALHDFLQQIQGVSNELVGSQILALQTRMQASMQTTAMLFQTSLVNYLR